MATATKKAAATRKPVNTNDIDALLLNEATQEKTVSDVLLTNGEDLIVGTLEKNSSGLTMYVSVLARRTRAYAITFPQGVPCPFSPGSIIDAHTLVVRHGKPGLASYVTHGDEGKKGIEGRLLLKEQTFGLVHFLEEGEAAPEDELNRQRRLNRTALNEGTLSMEEYYQAQHDAAQRFAALL